MLVPLSLLLLQLRAAERTSHKTSSATGDTMFVRATVAYIISSRRRDHMPSAQILDQAVDAYTRLFGATPPRIVMFLGADDSAAVAEPPVAKDTVWLSGTEQDTSAVRTSDVVGARYVLLALARGWIRAAIERAADSSRDNQSLALIPRWLETGTALQIAYSEASWARAMADAQRQVGVLPPRELFGNSDNRSLGEDGDAATRLQYAGLVRFLRDCAPRMLLGLPERLGRGDTSDSSLVKPSGLTLAMLDSAWRQWYRATAGSSRVLAGSGNGDTAVRCGQ